MKKRVLLKNYNNFKPFDVEVIEETEFHYNVIIFWFFGRKHTEWVSKLFTEEIIENID